MSSRRILYHKNVQDIGVITEMKIWEVPVSPRYPDGVKYSLYFIKGKKVVVGYGNHHPKGHHCHYGRKQIPYSFTTVEGLIRDFDHDRKRLHHES